MRHLDSTYVRQIVLAAILVVTATLVPFPGAAETETDTQTKSGIDEESPWEFGVGARIGGYGFRHVENDTLSWNDCRMNGVGLFATLDYDRRFFGELSVDYYHATGKTVSHGMNRMSMFVLGAIGARFFRDFFLTPYVQAGVGPEWTKIEVGHRRLTTLLAAPFVGAGVEANIGRLKLGSHIRTLAMGVPEHTGHGAGEHSHSGDETVPITYEVAGELQFFVRYAF